VHCDYEKESKARLQEYDLRVYTSAFGVKKKRENNERDAGMQF